MAAITDYLGFTLETFSHRPTRSWLTILGILIGIAAVVSLISLGQGLQDSINKQFASLGTDKILLYPGSGALGALAGVAGSSRFTDADVNVVEKSRGVDKAVGIITTLAKTEHDNQVKYTFILAYPPDKVSFSDFGTVSLLSGRELKGSDKYEAVIGYDISQPNELYTKPVRIGDSITIGGTRFAVVGIAAKIGNQQDDTQIYIPSNTANQLLNNPGYAAMYGFTKKGFDPAVVAANVQDSLRRARNEKVGQEDFTVSTTAQLMQTVGNVIGVVQMIVIGIASISLIVGGIGIMNTMYTSVLERTREIGVMKAIGARDSDVMMIFLLESGILGLFGGTIGALIGMGVGKLVEIAATSARISFSASFPPWLIIGSLVFSFIVGSLSGVLPALRAARLRPAEALRYE